MASPVGRIALTIKSSTSVPRPLARRLDVSAARPAVSYTPLAMWHLLSMDAPSVAALWMGFIARSAGVALSPASILSMFVAVWMLYAADRLLDARLLGSVPAQRESFSADADGSVPSLELRHYFHHRHRRPFLRGIAVAAVLLMVLLPGLPLRMLRLYVSLGALLIAWFLLIHTQETPKAEGAGSSAGAVGFQDSPAPHLPKELAVGVFFPAAIFVPTAAALPPLTRGLLAWAILFSAICTLNCFFLYRWEHPAGTTDAHWTTAFALRHLRVLAWLTVAASVLLAITAAVPTLQMLPGGTAVGCASALASLLLLALHAFRNRMSAVHLRAMADVALLSPLLWLLAMWKR